MHGALDTQTMMTGVLPDPRFSLPRTLVYGVGAAKSATSWLNSVLRMHPSVHVAFQRELHYWDVVRWPFRATPRDSIRSKLAKLESQPFWQRRILRAPTYRYYRAAARMHDSGDASHRDYADVLFRGYRGQPVVGEVTPGYALLGAETYAEMAALNSDSRFVFVMRDPLARLHSGIRHELRKCKGAAAVTETQVLDRLRTAIADPSSHKLARARYDRTINALEAAVPTDRIFYAFFEGLFTPKAIKRLFAFLKVPTIDVNFGAVRNAGVDTGQDMNPEFVKLASDYLAPVYEFIRNKFAEHVPEAWGQAGATGGQARLEAAEERTQA